jgi:hypothetical protein
MTIPKIRDSSNIPSWSGARDVSFPIKIVVKNASASPPSGRQVPLWNIYVESAGVQTSRRMPWESRKPMGLEE